MHLPAHGSATVALSVPYADLAYYYPPEKQMVLEVGEYTFFVCRDSGTDGCFLAVKSSSAAAAHAEGKKKRVWPLEQHAHCRDPRDGVGPVNMDVRMDLLLRSVVVVENLNPCISPLFCCSFGPVEAR